MTEDSANPSQDLSGAAATTGHMDTICDHFIADWKADSSPQIEAYMLQWTGDPELLLAKLLPLEIDFRISRGNSPNQQEYLDRFTAHANLVRNVFAALETVSQEAGIDTKSYLPANGALTMRCPFCHNHVVLTELPTLGDISCPDCQSIFSLAPDSTDPKNPVKRMYGQFELQEQLGMGSFGSVWKSRDTELDRIVAIKIPRRTELDAEDIEKFVREARAAAQLNHPNIVGVHEVGREGETIYIVSDYIEGLSLDQWLEGQHLTPQEATTLCRKIALALHHAHEEGIVHRDLKPSNIMMDGQGEPHVMDFGLAKREAGEVTMTLQGQILGTPAYMSPEQAKGEGYNADRRSDIYSLGVILFELLTGERPFRASNVRMLLDQVIEDEPPHLRKFDSRIAEDLETITLKCLEKEPTDRYSSALDVAEELGRYSRQEPIHARKISQAERGWRWCKRNPVVAGLSVAVLLVLCGGIVATSIFAIDARREANAKTVALMEKDQQAELAQKEAARANAEKTRAQEQTRIAKQQEEFAKEQQRVAKEQENLAQEQARLATEQEKIANQRLYAAQIAAAQRAWKNNEILLAWEELEKCREEYLGWEFRYLSNLFAGTLKTLGEHERTVNALSFSPDGKRIASGSYHRVRIWDVESRKQTGALEGYESFIWSVAYSPDGKSIVVGSDDHTIKVWDAETLEVVLTLTGHSDAVTSASFDSEGKRIVSGSRDGFVKIWNATSGEEIRTLNGHTESVNTVAFSPDGKSIASGSSDMSIKIWEVATGEEVRTLNGHEGFVWNLAYSPDGQRIVSGSSDRTAKVWDVKTGTAVITTEEHQHAVRGVSFSPDGEQVISLGSMVIHLWNANTGEEVDQLKGHVHSSWCVAFSPDGQWIATGSADKSIKIWDADADKRAHRLKGQSKSVLDLVFHPSGEQFVSCAADSTIKVWDTKSESETRTLLGHTGVAKSLDFSPDGKKLVSRATDNTIRVWDFFSDQKPLIIPAPQDIMACVVFSPDGEQVVSEVFNNEPISYTLKFWNSKNGEEMRSLLGYQNYISRIVFSPDGQRMILSYEDGPIKVIQVDSGEELFELRGHKVVARGIAFRPDGQRIVTGSNDHTIKVWDAHSGQELSTLTGHAGNVRCVAFSPDGQRIVSGSGDKTVKIWDAESGEETLSLRGHDDSVSDVAFSPDGDRIVSASGDGSIIIWSAASLGRSSYPR